MTWFLLSLILFANTFWHDPRGPTSANETQFNKKGNIVGLHVIGLHVDMLHLYNSTKGNSRASIGIWNNIKSDVITQYPCLVEFSVVLVHRFSLAMSLDPLLLTKEKTYT